MDSVSQIVLGAAVAAAVAPRIPRRAVVYGAIFGTLPDLDTFLLSGLDPLRQFTEHRAWSHSLIVLSVLAPVLALLSWQIDRGLQAVGRLRWCLAVSLVLLTHPLLDALTVYGTQLLWPLPFYPPTMWGSLFIIDPLYTLPLLIAVLLVWRRGEDMRRVRSAAMIGLVLSTAYVGWSVWAKQLATERAEVALAEAGHGATQLMVSPAPFTTLMWRAVAVGPQGDGEAFVSLRPGAPEVRWRWTHTEPAARSAAMILPGGQKMHWFTHGFMRVAMAEHRLRIADLRMGADGDYFFVFDVGERQDGRWQAITPERAERPRARADRLRDTFAHF
ncbi:metal-dependent hydrolase [Pseudomarimonas salicorniae]|uniref:Metal-dependent hydrolase n=1 Tax=Pseudomarimonas salicorniae TaxID=2933270 RepID=A0ABT0GEW3_9GAMM|nr:metal-dependent hydrolase [Lysobacter sp. CAU 1642]MCK7592892.1 metal-dependent hydrolase [Lysobacter sp. CAU 1642]